MFLNSLKNNIQRPLFEYVSLGPSKWTTNNVMILSEFLTSLCLQTLTLLRGIPLVVTKH